MNRCVDNGDKHMVYITQQSDEFPPHDQPTAEMVEDNNIVSFSDLSEEIISGVKYKWRVDCIDGDTGNRRSGDVWTFTMNA